MVCADRELEEEAEQSAWEKGRKQKGEKGSRCKEEKRNVSAGAMEKL